MKNVIRKKKTLVGGYKVGLTASGEEPVAGSGWKEKPTLGLVTSSTILTRLKNIGSSKTILFQGVRELRGFDTVLLWKLWQNLYIDNSRTLLNCQLFNRWPESWCLGLDLIFRRDVDEICNLLGYYAASCGNCLPTFRNNVSVPSSRVKSPSGPRRPQISRYLGLWHLVAWLVHTTYSEGHRPIAFTLMIMGIGRSEKYEEGTCVATRSHGTQRLLSVIWTVLLLL